MPARSLTLAILVDGLRHDYVTAADSPYLATLGDRGAHLPMRETFGFQTRAAFFAGLYPETSDIANLYVFDPDAGPFRFLRFAPRALLHRIDHSRFASRVRNYSVAIAQRFEGARGHDFGALITSAAEIPLELLRYFAVSEIINSQAPGAYPGTSLFDLLRAHALPWIWVAYPTHDLRVDPVESEFHARVTPDHRFVYLHYGELDWVGHQFGPDAPERRRTLRQISASIERVVRYAERSHNPVHVLVFGDHGMVEVTDTVDPRPALAKLRRECGPFVHFLDSNQIRVWLSDSRNLGRASEILAEIKGGEVLSESALRAIRAARSRRYGDLVFLLEGGKTFTPNFFQGFGSVRGMHGYHPDVRDNDAALIVAPGDASVRVDSKRDRVELVDVFPTLTTLLDLPIPPTNEGSSLAFRG